MRVKKLNVTYFSATGTSKKIARSIAKGVEAEQVEEFDLTHARTVAPVLMDETDLLLIVVPSYSGRVPQLILQYLNDFRGEGTPAIVACTYGNRDYDDTLVELYDIVTANGFRPISAGAFVAQHSLFPKLAEGRPSADDLQEAEEFGANSAKLLSDNVVGELDVKGGRPYRQIASIPLRPRGDGSCTKCGVCVNLCPVGAIPEKHPRRTDKKLCISCAHCVSVCPSHSRSFGGLLYMLASRKFYKKFTQEKTNEIIFSK